MPKKDEKASLIGRIVGAIMAFVLIGLTVIFIPWLLAWKSHIRLGLIHGHPSPAFITAFYIWALIVALAALYMGFKSGIYETMDILNILWKTGESYDPKVLAMAETLRNIMIISAIATFILFSLR